jgi:hypothetical protein
MTAMLMTNWTPPPWSPQLYLLGLSAAMGLTGFALFRAMDTPTRVKYAKGLRRFMLESVHYDREGRLLEMATRAYVILLLTHPLPEEEKDAVRPGGRR